MGGESNAGQFIGPEQRNVCVGYSPTKRNDDMAHDLVDYLAQNLCYETQGEKDYEEFENHLFSLFFLDEGAAGCENCACDCQWDSVRAQWIGYHRQKPGWPRFIWIQRGFLAMARRGKPIHNDKG